MFRYENTYDVLITRHTLSPHQDMRPEIESKIVFFRRAGTLTTELWGKDSAFRGGAVLDALLKVTEAVCCVGCKHSHLLEMGAQPCYLKQSFAEVGV